MNARVPIRDALVDQRFFEQWLAHGFLAIAVYLAKHADFSRYVETRERGVRSK